MHFVFIFLSFSFYLNFDVLRFCLPVEEAVQMMMMMMMMIFFFFFFFFLKEWNPTQIIV